MTQLQCRTIHEVQRFRCSLVYGILEVWLLSYWRIGQAVGLSVVAVSWPQAKVKCLPSVPTALQVVLPTELARIAASSPQHARSGRSCCRSVEKPRRPTDAVSVARTTAKSR
ncbi:MAG: hypothetical protein RIS47_492 [Bacteroidota bacterium]|jgi:hypothetical protein